VKTAADLEAITLGGSRTTARELEILGTEPQFTKYASTFFNQAWREYVDGVWSPPTRLEGVARRPRSRRAGFRSVHQRWIFRSIRSEPDVNCGSGPAQIEGWIAGEEAR
jgi:hypothetical protein